MDSTSNLSSGEPSSIETLPTTVTRTSFYEAAQAVLSTNELICDIIVRLPLDDIVIATGVCRAWRQALKDNVAVQQAMFLTPDNSHKITTTEGSLSKLLEDITRKENSTIVELHPFISRICGQTLSAHAYILTTALSIPADCGSRVGLENQPTYKHSAGAWRDISSPSHPSHPSESSSTQAKVLTPSAPP